MNIFVNRPRPICGLTMRFQQNWILYLGAHGQRMEILTQPLQNGFMDVGKNIVQARS